MFVMGESWRSKDENGRNVGSGDEILFMKSLHTRLDQKQRHCFAFLGIATAASLLSFHPAAFVLSREGLAQGEYWRLLSGHLVHFSPQHLLANLGALALMLYRMAPLTRRGFLWMTLAVPLLLSIGICIFRPTLAVYGGLSGWLSALFVWMALDHSRKQSALRPIFRGAIVLLGLKIGIEMLNHAPLFAALGDGIVVEPAAHALGAVLGFIGHACCTRKKAWHRDSGSTVVPGGPTPGRGEWIPGQFAGTDRPACASHPGDLVSADP